MGWKRGEMQGKRLNGKEGYLGWEYQAAQWKAGGHRVVCK